MDNDIISSHYDKKIQFTTEERKFSKIIGARSFNNWVKAVLINEYVRSGDRVVDLCCGKGGDLTKWKIAHISYLLAADISSISVEQCQERYANLNPKFDAEFYTVNCFSDEFLSLVKEHSLVGTFDVVSCQLAYHYSFASKESLLSSLQSISSCLRPNGVFIATLPDSDVIFHRLMKAPGLSFGNDLYQVTFDTKENFAKYGQKYSFFLQESIDNCPEYMVHIETLRTLAKTYGLEMEYKSNFETFFEQYKHKYNSLLKKMMNTDSNNKEDLIDKKEWEVATLYLAIVFIKKK